MIDLGEKKYTGTILYYLLWPLVLIYAPLRIRVRVLLMVDGDVAVVKNWFGPNSWQLPGGGAKKGEPAALTAVREIQEELGLVLDPSGLQQLSQKPLLLNSGGIFYRYQYILCKLEEKPALIMSHGITDTKWAALESVAIPTVISARII